MWALSSPERKDNMGMKVSLRGRNLRVHPEGSHEKGFFEEDLGLKDDGDVIFLVRRNVPGRKDLAFLETMPQDEHSRQYPKKEKIDLPYGYGVTAEDERTARAVEENLGEIEDDVELKTKGLRRKIILKEFVDGEIVPDGAEHVSSVVMDGKVTHTFLVSEIVRVKSFHDDSMVATCGCGEPFMRSESDSGRELCDKCLLELEREDGVRRR